MKAAVQHAYEFAPTEVSVSATMLETVLAPYKLHCRYLQGASVEKGNPSGSLMTAWGRFAIDESCYIADTGHFNAVEFNICYNQLTYCLLAESIHHQMLDVLSHWSLAEFRHSQLSNFLIVQFRSTFRKPLNARQFEGRVDIDKVTVRKGSIFMKTSCSFVDSEGATSDGEALIVILDNGHKRVSAT